MSKPGKVLVTGSSSFLGRHLIPMLDKEEWSVVKTTRNKDEIGVDCPYLDLEQPESVLALSKSQDFDYVIHLGAKIAWNESAGDSLLMANVLSTGLLAEAACKKEAYFVYASAMIIHGLKCSKVDANSPVNTDSSYARSKYLGELLLSESGVKHCNLRFAGIFGRNGPTHLGINRSIDAAIKSEPPVQVGTGKALRNYIYVKDAARAIVFAIETRLEGTHLCAGSEVISIKDMLSQICEVCSSGLKPILREGQEASDQVVLTSRQLPLGRTFREALADISS